MKYSKELHDRLRNRTGLHGFNHFVGVDSGDIDALLDEIERLNSHIVVMEDTIAELRRENTLLSIGNRKRSDNFVGDSDHEHDDRIL